MAPWSADQPEGEREVQDVVRPQRHLAGGRQFYSHPPQRSRGIRKGQHRRGAALVHDLHSALVHVTCAPLKSRHAASRKLQQTCHAVIASKYRKVAVIPCYACMSAWPANFTSNTGKADVLCRANTYLESSSCRLATSKHAKGNDSMRRRANEGDLQRHALA